MIAYEIMGCAKKGYAIGPIKFSKMYYEKNHPQIATISEKNVIFRTKVFGI